MPPHLTLAAGFASAYTRREVIYARSFGTALTMDVFSPEKKANGAGVILFISEGWYSDHAKIEEHIPRYIEPLLVKGYTVFAVVHGSNPKFTLPENIEDAHRAVRFIRHHAQAYGIDPNRIGSTGDSAGGHLSLMVGCAGRAGQPQAPDPVDTESSQVQAVVAFYPPTDFLNWGKPGKHMLGQHPLVSLEGAFDFARLNPETNAFQRITAPKEREAIGRHVSPISHVGPNNAPTLLVVGDADTFIPPQQSESMAAKLKAAGVASELVVMPGGGHDETTITRHLPQALAWFDRHLAARTAVADQP
ncbi:Acetyl esterase/lipase [Hymenobacter daecheongensis DSM 21074]|uniref:Acetyl esterase/lipase n=1 Tax=Hymenobacter daecheongensis DSM 21074 TaxID=1121955 RepID=A0A1M6KSY6_9BACT|nr:alpha/beta hydrolase [Hymenobacter daecheongensis]SHJ62039.1 Acetyl esterase/lipase [Hymenobacter daecheongensis DSM 21074]